MLNAGHFVARQSVGEHVAILHDELFGQGIAQTHHHAAFDLTLQGQRVDSAADVVRGDHPQNVNFAGLRVHFHFGGLGGERKAEVHVAVLAIFGKHPQRLSLWRPVLVKRFRLAAFVLHHHRRLADGNSVAVDPRQPFFKSNGIGWHVVFFCKHGRHCFAQSLGREPRSVARHIGLPRGGRRPAVGSQVRIR